MGGIERLGRETQLGSIRETGASLDAREEGRDEDGIESVVREAAELDSFVSPCHSASTKQQ